MYLDLKQEIAKMDGIIINDNLHGFGNFFLYKENVKVTYQLEELEERTDYQEISIIN